MAIVELLALIDAATTLTLRVSDIIDQYQKEGKISIEEQQALKERMDSIRTKIGL